MNYRFYGKYLIGNGLPAFSISNHKIKIYPTTWYEYKLIKEINTDKNMFLVNGMREQVLER